LGVGGDGEGRKSCAGTRAGGGNGKAGGFGAGDGDTGGERGGAGDNAGGGCGILGRDARFGNRVEINFFRMEGGRGRSQNWPGVYNWPSFLKSRGKLVHGSGQLIDLLGKLGGPRRLRRRCR